MPEMTAAFLRESRGRDAPLFTERPKYVAQKLNDALSKTSGETFTSYSFRRAFMFQVFKDCKGYLEKAKRQTTATQELLSYSEWAEVNDKDGQPREKRAGRSRPIPFHACDATLQILLLLPH